MTRPPLLQETLQNVAYPEVAEQALSNGLRVLTVYDDRLPRISLQLALAAGRAHSPDDNLAAFPAALELLREGTRRRSSLEISDLLDHWAIHYETDLSMEHVLISAVVLEPYLEQALDLLSEIISQASFPAQELEKLRRRWRSILSAQRSQPDFLAHERTFHTFYPGHPYAKVSIPLEHLEKTDRDAVEGAYRRFFAPHHAWLLLAGPVHSGPALDCAERFFGRWEPREFAAPEWPSVPPWERRSVGLVHRPYSAQSRIMVGIRTLPRPHPETLPLKLVNQVLGGGGSARLFLNLREARGYTYGAYSQLKAYRQDGLLLASANVNSQVTSEAIQEVLKEMEAMRQAPPSREELGRCQAELIGAFLRRTETAASVGELELHRRIYGLPEDYYETFIPRLRAATVEEVWDLSRRLLDPQRVLITVVADRAQVEKDLRQFGDVRVYDTLGNQAG